MFSIEPHDSVPLDTFAIRWRWTEAQHTALPPAHLHRIQPLTEAKAQAAYAYAKAFQGSGYRTRFREVAEFAVGDREDAGVARWLRDTLPDGPALLFISWTERFAAAVAVDTFIAYWSSFCYPVEDVVIWPQHEGWVLLFDYKQRFYFAVAA